MTEKDYILIAEAMKEARRHILREDAGEVDGASMAFGLKAAAMELANKLAEDNPMFNRDAFISACGVVN